MKSIAYATRHRRAAIKGYLFVSPWLVGFFVFTAAPMVVSFYLAFTDYRGMRAPNFVGLENFERLASDRYFWISLYNTAYYTFLGIPIFILTALTYALILNTNIRGQGVYRTIFYIPSIVPAVASAIIWVWIFNPDLGFANVLLGWLHLPPLNWLWDPALAKPCFILMGLWGAGSGTLIFLAALQGVPMSLYEAATIDGAGAWQRFIKITLPLISPAIFFNLIMGIIGSFQVFTTAYVATGGGPINATLFLLLYLYRMAFESFWMGYASALAWVVFVILLIFTIIQVRGSKRWVYYEGGARP